jgi:hypothetical protein
MSSQVYHGLDMSTNWYCNKCETPNDTSALYQSVLLDSIHTGSYMSGDSKHINNNSSINLQHQNHNITNIENVGSPIVASSPKVKKTQTNTSEIQIIC